MRERVENFGVGVVVGLYWGVAAPFLGYGHVAMTGFIIATIAVGYIVEAWRG